MRIRLFAERRVTPLNLAKPTVALMKSRSIILPVSTSPERKFSIPSRRSALRKPESRFTRARIVSLKSRVRAIGSPSCAFSQFVVLPSSQCHLDIPLLASFRSAANEDHQPVAVFPEVNSVAWTKINPILTNPRFDALDVGQITLDR